MGKRAGKSFRDTCVIYASKEDDCWIAHSLHTDQIGTGDCVLGALVDLLRAYEQLLTTAAEEEGIEIRREAPPKIQRLAERAYPMPQELCEIAYKIVHGDWPEDIEVEAKSPKKHPLKTELQPVPA